MFDEGLTLWTIYDHPRDHPDMFVARKFIYDRPTMSTLMSGDLERLRDTLRGMGLVCINRDPSDDPKIVETWL
jgi:hypothetical protein